MGEVDSLWRVQFALESAVCFGECSLLCTWDYLARHSPKLVCIIICCMLFVVVCCVRLGCGIAVCMWAACLAAFMYMCRVVGRPSRSPH